MSIVRVKSDVACSVYDEDTDTRYALTPGMEFDSGDPLVRKFGWAFQIDAEADVRRQRRTSVEMATAEPGEKRNR